MLASVGTVSAQTGGGTSPPPPTYKPFPKIGSGTTTDGTKTGGSTSGTTPGSGGFGFGRQAVLTPAQELAVLMETLTMADAILNSGQFQFNSEIEVLFLLVYIYEMNYAQAVEAAVLGGSGGPGGVTLPLGGGITGSGTIPGTGTPSKP